MTPPLDQGDTDPPPPRADTSPPAIAVFMPTMEIGGAEMAMTRLAGAFAAAGHRVAIVVQYPPSARPLPLPRHVELVVLNIRHTRATPPALARFAVTWRADVLIAALPHNNLAAIAAGLIVRMRHRRPLLVLASEHAPIESLIGAHPGWRYRVLPLLQWLFYPFATAIICASNGVAADFRANLPRRATVRTIYNPIVAAASVNTPTDSAPQPERPAGIPLIVTAGRLAPEKDLTTLLHGFARLRARQPARLIIAGDGPERARLMAIATALNITDDLEITGFTNDLPALLRTADVFVLTSRFEGFGNVIVEALACGVPVVATDCPVGPREILADGRYGRLVPVGDADAIAHALHDMLHTRFDRAALRARAADFTIEASAAAYRGMIDRALPRPIRPADRRSIAIYMHDFSSGGVERAVLSLIGAFRAAGFDVTLLVHADSGPLRALLPADLAVVVFGTRRTIADLPLLVRYLRTHRPDILLANLDHNNLVATMAIMIARTASKLVIAQHNALSAEAEAMRGLNYRLLPTAYRLLAPRADAIVAVSAGVADDLAHCARLDRARITVIHNPVVTPDFAARAAAPVDHAWLRAASTIPVFITAGRLVGQKDHATLIRAFALARRRVPMRLIILGEGALRPRLEALVDDLALGGDVLLPGSVANPLPWFAAATAFVLSSAYEGFGNVLVEAMACGTPVISTDCPHGPAEILDHGRYGRLVPTGDIARLADALDPDIRRLWSADTLKARADRYTLAASAQGYHALFDRVYQTAPNHGVAA
ncbi:glycosyltransferase [Acidiphilium sp.]|uniref:glycosyltransferase n=1 Tax=Acidiphilium sp. TaxID=527 RepID=UPI003CFC7CB9